MIHFTFANNLQVVAIESLHLKSTRDYYFAAYPNAKYLVNSIQSSVVYAICETELEAQAALDALNSAIDACESALYRAK